MKHDAVGRCATRATVALGITPRFWTKKHVTGTTRTSCFAFVNRVRVERGRAVEGGDGFYVSARRVALNFPGYGIAKMGHRSSLHSEKCTVPHRVALRLPRRVRPTLGKCRARFAPRQSRARGLASEISRKRATAVTRVTRRVQHGKRAKVFRGSAL